MPSKPSVFPLNPAQKAAAEAPSIPLLIVAGAGTGKTRTLTSRIAHLVATGTSASRICAITFTNKAAKEMLNRLPGHPDLFIGTFHSLGARILRKECHAFRRDYNFVIFDDHDTFDLLKKIIKKHGLLEKDKKYNAAFFRKKISDIKNAAAKPEADKKREDIVRAVFQEYEAALARNNAFDFDDLLEKPVVLWKKDSAVLEKYQKKFDAVFVDEYQDINPMQYEFVKLLASSHKNLSVVGDDEQTIYSWRYADIRTFLNFDKDWPGAKVYFLEENYRSTGNVIRAAQTVAEKNRYRTPKKLWTANPEGEPISLYEAWGENDEAEWIVGEIEKATVPRSENAILYRTNAQSRAIEQALIRHNIPYQIFGGLKFYERREVKDAVAALRYAMNSRDEVARERLEKNLTKRKFVAFARKIGEGAAKLTPVTIIKIFLEAFDYFDHLENNFTNAGEREENIAELLSFAAEASDLPIFLEKISLLQATDDEAAGKQKDETTKVNLMTVHLAKGLEFKNVFIAGASEGLLPHVRSVESEEQLEEERRLMYVAMTRAKEKLHISFYGMPSRFITEIPEECIVIAANQSGDETEDTVARRSGGYKGWDDDGAATDEGENVIYW